MKSRLTVCLLIPLLFTAVIPVAGQTAMRNFKLQLCAVSMDEATVVDMEALPLKVGPNAAAQATFHNGGSILRSGLAYYPQGRWGITQALPSTEAQFGSVACTRTPADCGTQVSERPGIPLRLNHSLSVSGGEETKHIGAGDVSRPVCIFLARTTAAHESCVLILNIDRFRSSPAARGVSVLPFAWANPNPPSLSATSQLARHQM